MAKRAVRRRRSRGRLVGVLAGCCRAEPSGRARGFGYEEQRGGRGRKSTSCSFGTPGCCLFSLVRCWTGYARCTHAHPLHWRLLGRTLIERGGGGRGARGGERGRWPPIAITLALLGRVVEKTSDERRRRLWCWTPGRPQYLESECLSSVSNRLASKRCLVST